MHCQLVPMLIVTIPHVLVADVDFKGRDIDGPVVAFKCDCLKWASAGRRELRVA